MDTHRPKSPRIRLYGHPLGKNRLWRCVWAILRGGNHLKWGFARAKRPRIRDSVRLARDPAIFLFQPAGHIWGPNKPILGPTGPRKIRELERRLAGKVQQAYLNRDCDLHQEGTRGIVQIHECLGRCLPSDTVSGSHGSKHGQKATQALPKLILSINLHNGTFLGPPLRHRGPFLVILGHFGPAWGPTWGPPWARPLWHGALWRPRHGPSGSQRCLLSPKPSRIAW